MIRQAIFSLGLALTAFVLRSGPEAEFTEMLREGGGWIVGVEAAGVGEDPGMAAAEAGRLEADAGVFDAGDDAVRTHAQKGNDRRTPITYFGLEALATGTELL